MKHKIILLISFLSGLLFILSCNNNGRTKIERKGEPTITIVRDDDSAVNNAIAKARGTLNEFNKALLSNNPDYSYFDLKVKYKYGGANNDEHIWIRDIKYIDGNYYGFVGNVPEFVQYLKLGDSVKINDNDISDWMYMDRNKLKGGYTIRALRNTMSEDEKRKIDRMIGDSN